MIGTTLALSEVGVFLRGMVYSLHLLFTVESYFSRSPQDSQYVTDKFYQILAGNLWD